MKLNVTQKKHTRTIKLLLLIIYLIQTSFLFSQQGNWGFGSYRMPVGPSSGPLTYSMRGKGSLSSYAFVSGVGGVAFEGVAIPQATIKADSLFLFYDGERSDGKRLLVLTKNDTINALIPDWQLIPIAKYSNSEFNASVSIFGPNTSPTHFDVVYHPAFENTLLGLRLLQADIQLMDLETFWELPRYNRNGESEIVFGFGEKKETIYPPLGLIAEIQSAIGSEFFQSWVLTDVDVTVQFSFIDNEIILNGNPYYHFWYAENFQPFSIDKRNELVLEINKYSEFIPVLEECGCKDKMYEYNEKRKALMAQLEQMEPKVHDVNTLTTRMKTKTAALYNYNPNVFGAARTTMQYSAFFSLNYS